MIRLVGAAFTTATDGDQRSPSSRESVSRRLGIDPWWAEAEQVHGSDVALVHTSGPAGPVDGLITTTPGLPLAVRTADCAGVVLQGPGVVGVAHAGWRGIAAGIVARVASAMGDAAAPPTVALIGPHIGPCCFEVGAEVAGAFPDAVARTTWGTTSVDLAGAIEAHAGGIPVHRTGGCTMCGAGWFSHRATGTPERLASIAWMA